jgi:uncharacterized protein YciI
MFIIIVKYLSPIEVIDELLISHRAFLDKYYENGMLICSGPQNPRTGGIILSKAPNIEAIEKMISEDPFYINKAADYEIIEFNPVKHTKGFEPFIR